MRTTILLPDELYRRVKLTAAAEQRTMTSLIEQALRETLERRRESADAPPFRVDVITGHRLRAGVDLDDGVALEELMCADDRD